TEDVWALAEADYFGGASAGVVSARYGMSRQSIYLRVSGRGKHATARAVATPPAASEAASSLDAVIVHDDATLADAVARLMAFAFGARPGGSRRLLAEVVRRLMFAAHVRQGRLRRKGGRDRILHFSDEIWAAARRDYGHGGFTVPAIARRYGIP